MTIVNKVYSTINFPFHQFQDGKKIVEKEVILDVSIAQGTPEGFRIKIEGEGN